MGGSLRPAWRAGRAKSMSRSPLENSEPDDALTERSLHPATWRCPVAVLGQENIDGIQQNGQVACAVCL